VSLTDSPHDPRLYWPRYCEENVWHLCGALGEDVDEAFAVFVSSPGERVAVWCQRAGRGRDRVIAWDYHVVLLQRRGALWEFVDPDSTLSAVPGAPVPAAEYLDRSFRPLPRLYATLRPRFRLVPAADYRRHLCSDRSHMRTRSGRWHSPPPPWPCIGEGTNLMRFVDMRGAWLGEVLDLAGLSERLGLDEERVSEPGDRVR
jgi:hypothetical protein